MAHKYTIEQFEQRLSELATAQRRIVKEESEEAWRLIREEENADKAAEHIAAGVQAEAQAGAYDHARGLLRQMNLIPGAKN